MASIIQQIKKLHLPAIPTEQTWTQVTSCVFMHKKDSREYYRIMSIVIQNIGNDLRMYDQQSFDRASFTNVKLDMVTHVFTTHPLSVSRIPDIIILASGVDGGDMDVLAVCSTIWDWNDTTAIKCLIREARMAGYVGTWHYSNLSSHIHPLFEDITSNQTFVGGEKRPVVSTEWIDPSKKSRMDPDYISAQRDIIAMLAESANRQFLDKPNIGVKTDVINNEFPSTPAEEAFEDVFIGLLSARAVRTIRWLHHAQSLILSFAIASAVLTSEHEEVRNLLVLDLQGVKGLTVEKLCQVPTWTTSRTKLDRDTLTGESDYVRRMRTRGRVISNVLVWFFTTQKPETHPAWNVAANMWQMPFMDERHRGIVIEQAMRYAPHFVLNTALRDIKCWNRALFNITVRSAHMLRDTISALEMATALTAIDVILDPLDIGLPQSRFKDSLQCWALTSKTDFGVIRTSYMKQETGLAIQAWLSKYEDLVDPFEWTDIGSDLKDNEVLVVVCDTSATRRLVAAARCQVNNAEGRTELYIIGADVLRIGDEDSQVGNVLFGAIDTVATLLSCTECVLHPATQRDRIHNLKFHRPMRIVPSVDSTIATKELKLDESIIIKIFKAVYDRDHKPTLPNDLQERVYIPRGYSYIEGNQMHKAVHPSLIPGSDPSIFRSLLDSAPSCVDYGGRRQSWSTNPPEPLNFD